MREWEGVEKIFLEKKNCKIPKQTQTQGEKIHWTNWQHSQTNANLEKPPFEMYCLHMGIARKGGGGWGGGVGCKGLSWWFGAFFPHVCERVKGLASMVWDTFSMFARLAERGSKNIWAMPI